MMGFTDRMGDVLAAGNALVHSSAGLTVLEAIIRGCPVVSYGFGVGHVRASNAALERFGLAQVARKMRDLGPAIQRALESHPEPDPSFARRPSTASLILNDERRARTLPRWRLRTARAATGMAATVAVGGWALTAGASYSLVAHFVHMRPVTTVSTTQPEVGILVDAPRGQLPALANVMSTKRMRVSYSLDRPPSGTDLSHLNTGDEAVPRLHGGGLVRWLGTRGQLRRVLGGAGINHRHFLYVAASPSIGQWLMARRAGGRPVAGAVRLDGTDHVGPLRAGEVVELTPTNAHDLSNLATELGRELKAQHLTGVPVSQLMHDAGKPG
jgi:hypothetical protein